MLISLFFELDLSPSYLLLNRKSPFFCIFVFAVVFLFREKSLIILGPGGPHSLTSQTHLLDLAHTRLNKHTHLFTEKQKAKQREKVNQRREME